MSEDNFHRVGRGDPLKIPATTYNAFIDAAVAHRQSVLGGAVSSTKQLHRAAPLDVVEVSNHTAVNFKQYDVIGLNGLRFSQSDNEQEFAERRYCFKAMAPAAGKAYAVLLEPLPTNAISRACVSGVVPVRVEISDIAETFADVADEKTKLVAGRCGSAQILYVQEMGEDQWAVVRLLGSLGTHDEEANLEPADEDVAQEAAAEDEWDIKEQDAEEDGVVIRVQTRTVYDCDGDRVLYAFDRNLTFDSHGRLVLVSAESRRVVDTPEACS